MSTQKRSPTDERNRAITQAQIDYERARTAAASNNGNGPARQAAIADKAGAQYCSADGCGGVAVITPDAARRPVSLAVLISLVVGAATLLGGWIALDGHLREARAAALRDHSTSSAAHPDIRSAVVRAAGRIEAQLQSQRQEARQHQERVEAMFRALQQPARGRRGRHR